jgi:hypothetical protein
VPTSVVSSTIKAASLFVAGQAVAAGAISVKVAALTEGVLNAMLLNKLKGALVMLALVVAGLVPASGFLLPTYAGDKGRELTIPLNPQDMNKPEDADFNKTILALEAKFWGAAMKFDGDAMRNIYADDFVAFSERGRSVKAACVEATKQYRSANMKFRNVEIIRLNADAAIVTYRLDQDVFARDGRLVVGQRNCRMSNSWARREGRWVFVFSQMTQMP